METTQLPLHDETVVPAEGFEASDPFSASEMIRAYQSALLDQVAREVPSLALETERERHALNPEALKLYGLMREHSDRMKQAGSDDDKNRLRMALNIQLDEFRRGDSLKEFMRLDFSGLDLSGLNLSGFDLSDCRCRGANFSSTDLRGTKIVRADVEDAVFDNSQVGFTFLIGANAKGASFNGVENPNGLNMALADLRRASLDFDHLDPWQYIGARISETEYLFPAPEVIDPAEVPNKTLQRGDEIEEQARKVVDQALNPYLDRLRAGEVEADPESRALYDALRSIDSLIRDGSDPEAVKQAKMEWIAQKDRLIADGHLLVFDGFDLSGLVIGDMDFSHISLIGANLADSDLTWSNFSGADLAGATFEGSSLRMTNFRGSRCLATSFKRADLTASRMRETAHILSDFGGATLTYVDGKGMVLVGADFSEAMVRYTNFGGVYYGQTVTQAKLVASTNFAS